MIIPYLELALIDQHVSLQFFYSILHTVHATIFNVKRIEIKSFRAAPLLIHSKYFLWQAVFACTQLACLKLSRVFEVVVRHLY